MAESKNEIVSLAELADSYKFDISKPQNKLIFSKMVSLAEKRQLQEESIIETKSKATRRLLNIIVWALAITITASILLNSYNHARNIELNKFRIEHESTKEPSNEA